MDHLSDIGAERPATCEKHGDYTSKRYLRNIWSSCTACAQEEREREQAEAEAQRKSEMVAKLLCRSGLEGRFLDATFESFATQTDAQAALLANARAYADQFVRVKHRWEVPGGGPWLIGPPGTGKTHIGSALVNHLIRDKEMPAHIRSARDIVRLLRSTWGNKRGGSNGWGHELPSTEDEMIEEFASAALLVLDEIGVSFGSDSEHVQLFDVLDLRYKRELPTVLLSNLPLKELRGALGDRVFDRLREGATILPCQWESHRKNGRKEAV